MLTAPNGASALQLLDSNPDVRLLFTDVGLAGGMDGRQLADEARQRLPGLFVLFTTGYTRNAIIHQGRLDPGVELIGKPFTYAALPWPKGFSARWRHRLVPYDARQRQCGAPVPLGYTISTGTTVADKLDGWPVAPNVRGRS